MAQISLLKTDFILPYSAHTPSVSCCDTLLLQEVSQTDRVSQNKISQAISGGRPPHSAPYLQQKHSNRHAVTSHVKGKELLDHSKTSGRDFRNLPNIVDITNPRSGSSPQYFIASYTIALQWP